MINEELVRAVAAKIREIPENWDQEAYVSECGTKFCFAGWALRLSGYGVQQRRQSRWTNYEFTGEGGIPLNDLEVFEVARNLLGLDREQAHRIFLCGWSSDVELILGMVSRETGVRGL